MKILVVSENFYPDTFAINDIVRILVERGHEVTVLTGLPDYASSEIPEEYRHGKNRVQDFCGAKVYRVPTIARHHGPIWRSLNYLSFVWSGNRMARHFDWPEFDVIYVWEVSPVTMALPAITLKKRYQKPLYLYCLDIWPECIKAMGFREGTPFYQAVRKLSGYIYRKCDHIAVSSRPFLQYLETVCGVQQEKMSYLPQFASSAMLEEDFSKRKEDHADVLGSGQAQLQTNGGDSEHTDFLYIGNIGKAQDMPCMIQAISMLKDRTDVLFHFVGGGSEYENTVELARKTGADRIIRFYGPKPFAEAKEYYRIADACIMTLDGSNRIGDTLPGKVQTYMAAGKPILGAMNGAGYEVITEAKCGMAVPAGDSLGLAEAFQKFAENEDAVEAARMGQNAREYFRAHFREEEFFGQLDEELQNVSTLN